MASDKPKSKANKCVLSGFAQGKEFNIITKTKT